MSRSKFLSKDYFNKLDTISTHVGNIWSQNEGIPVYFTIHDASHSKGVEEAIYRLIPNKKFLGNEEWFYLVSAAWLHDIGMIPDLNGLPSVSHEDARKDHHIRSRDYINLEAIYESLGL